jgi:hypothetical protein
MVWDASAGLPFSPFELASQPDAWKTNCFAIAEIFQYVFQLGDIQRGVIYDGMRDLISVRWTGPVRRFVLAHPLNERVL